MPMQTRYGASGASGAGRAVVAPSTPRTGIVLTLGIALVVLGMLFDPYWQNVIAAIGGPRISFPAGEIAPTGDKPTDPSGGGSGKGTGTGKGG